MSWNYKEPSREDYDTDEEYESALRFYDDAENDYIDRYVEERQMGER